MDSSLLSLLDVLTRTGRARLRRLREAETEAILAARRIQVAQLLASIGDYHLRMADLTRQYVTAEHPRLTCCSDKIMDSLADAIQNEIKRFGPRRPEVAR